MKLIDKSALIAEINRLMKWQEPIMSDSISFNAGHKAALNKLLNYLNTLEVKEVDLEKAVDDYIYTHDGRKRLTLELNWKCCNLTLKGGDGIIKFAKHFFELGMSVSNKAQKGEKV